MSRQQVLDLVARLDTGWQGWVRHAGVEEACARVALWLAHGGALWLDSPGAAGKSLLLRLVHEAEPRTALCVPRPAEDLLRHWLACAQGRSHWMLDLSGMRVPRAVALAGFHLMERARAAGAHMLVAVRREALDHAPPELASRVRAMPHVVLGPPDDEALARILREELRRRQWDAPPALVRALLEHAPRRLDAQIELLDALDKAALRERVRVTKAWVLRKLAAMLPPARGDERA